MENGVKKVNEIVKGDIVKTCSGVSKVVCVLKMKCDNNMNNLVELEGGLLITPFHPVRINGTW